MWSFKPKTLIHRDELLARILATHDIEGITVLGGEPLQQADNVIWLLNRIKKDSNLSTFLYTGYEKQELHTMGLWDELNTLCDIIAVGRYKQEDRNINRQWLGSDNQALIYFEGSGENMLQSDQNEVEIIIHPDGALTVLGFPDTEMVDLIQQI
jgi:anaerobic ribonucleoside-triphosphate reductase activating protein